MGRQDAVPDAWDDDWENQIDVSLVILVQSNADIHPKGNQGRICERSC